MSEQKAKKHISSRFYERIDGEGRITLPAEFLDRIEDLREPVGAEVFVYVAIAKRG